MTIRTTEEVISDLMVLITSKGYIYSLCLILFEDFHHNIETLHEVNPKEKLSVKECALIIGLLVQRDIDFSIPDSPEITLEMKETTYVIMKQFQQSLNSRQMGKLAEMFEKASKGDVVDEQPGERLDFFAKEDGMVEPMFYAGDGVYDFQYLEYLERKYYYDKEWLQKNRDFRLDETCQIATHIKETLHRKAGMVNLADVRKTFPGIAQKIRKKLKNQGVFEEQISQAERGSFLAANFYQYIGLFPATTDDRISKEENWAGFYGNLLDLFVIRKSDFDLGIKTDSFFRNFSFSTGGNQSYKGPGHFNILNACPLIKLDEDRYFAPINYLIPEAVYESPFYWMWEDKPYRTQLAKHRGDVGEEIAYELLSRVFGVENTYKSVLVYTRKGKPDTDIDVLCLLGNKALCVQVKSKKLTQAAKRGDFEQLSKDFKGAVQDAYDQGLVSRNAILNGKAVFQDAQGKEIAALNNRIEEVYILGLTTENYPSLVHQVHIMLNKEEQDPYPLFVSVFDLELLVYYLADPYDFLYYVRQRIALINYFWADEELVYLGYHLHRKLWKIEGYDGGSLDTDYGALIDRNYYPIKTGMAHLLSTKNDPIHNRWKGEKFELLTSSIKNSGHPQATDIIFQLMDWSGDSRENLVEHMIRYKSLSRTEGRQKSLATPTPPEFGLSYVVIETMDREELETVAEMYAVLRKYKSKCDAWLALGAYAGSPNLVDAILYLDEPWAFDADLQAESDKYFSQPNVTTFVPVNGKKKIGRNDPCPCKSGMKYKKCHGKS
jgi:hypothetical protein